MYETLLKLYAILFMVVEFLLFVCSVLGNLIVIFVIGRCKKLKSSSNLYILSVAFADLLIGVAIPLSVVGGITGEPRDFHVCMVINSFIMGVFATSMFCLTAISYDRYRAVCHPLSYHVSGTNRTKIVIALCWIFGFLCGFIPTFAWKDGVIDDKCDLRIMADLNYLLYMCGLHTVLSVVIIMILYVLIYRAILKQSKNRAVMTSNNDVNYNHKKEVKAAITLAMIVFTFIILWMPGMICLLIIAVNKTKNINFNILEIATMLVHLNAAIDPLIYAYRMRNIREAMKMLLRCNAEIRNIPSISYDSSKGNDS